MMKYLMKQLALTLVLAVMSVNMAQAVAPLGEQVIAAIALQGGSDSAVKWSAPITATYKVHIFVPETGAATNALYRVYPKGKRAGSTMCDSTDASYPCNEVTVDQTQQQNAWVQLTLNDDTETQWEFVKGKGYVTAVANNLSAADMLNLSAVAHFEDTVRAIGKSYQGGLIFYLDGTGEHGLIAAPTDRPGIQWYNGSYITTGATGTAVGTGRANTNKIIKAQGAGRYAAKLCTRLVIGAYSDWYLPSKNELNLMYHNIGPGAAAPLTNVGGFAGTWYWSSSEFNTPNAWGYAFGEWWGAGPAVISKFLTSTVRAVRAF